MKIKYGGNQTLDPKGGDIIVDKNNIADEGIYNICFNELSSWRFHSFRWRNPYGYPKKTLGRNAHIHHHYMVYGIFHHVDYL